MKKFSCNSDVVDFSLKKSLELASLFLSYGYERYKSSKFERYDLYREHRDFLVCDNIISITDTNGMLMALRPDVTLSIINSFSPPTSGVRKMYYDEDVYRVSGFTGKFKCYQQLGLECFGDVRKNDNEEVLLLALSSLSSFSNNFILAISDMNIIASVIKVFCLKSEDNVDLASLIRDKNIDEIKNFLRIRRVNPNYIDTLVALLELDSLGLQNCDKELKRICTSMNAEEEYLVFKSFLNFLKKTDFLKNIQIDFSVMGDMNYYSGLYFNGFIENAGEMVLSGGQYDKLLQKMNKSGKAIGFAIFMDRLNM